MALALEVVDGFATFDRFDSASALLASDAAAGQCELIAASARPANAWHAGCVHGAGGHPVPAWWSADPIIECPPVRLCRLREVYYAPAFGAVITANGAVMEHTIGQARFITPDLALLPRVARDGERLIFDPPDDLPSLPAAIVSMPWGAVYNYGHFVCDCLTSVALLSQLRQAAGHRCVFPPLQPWHRRHLELLGVAPLELDHPLYRIADVLFTDGIWQFINRPNSNFRLLRDIELRNKRATAVNFDKIYISRARQTQSAPDRRRFLSEAALEELLRERGFTIVTPELLSVDEQIDLFHNARLVVACRGAALANVVYCRMDTSIVEIIPTIPGFDGYQWVRDLCAFVGCRWRPYFVAGNPPETPVMTAGRPRPNAGFTFDVDIPDLIGFIEQLTQDMLAGP
jgi:capsular polysaccharide biosynthesis protein